MTIIENTSDARDILDTETKNHYGTPTDVSNDVPTDTMDALAAQNSTLRQNAASLLQSLEADRLHREALPVDHAPFVDEELASEQSSRMWTHFGDETAWGGLRGIREGLSQGDVDSGPLVLGISPSATGFVLGDATLRDRPARHADRALGRKRRRGRCLGGRRR